MKMKVDALAVMDRIQKQADTYPFTPVGHVIEHNIGADCFREARAAVAELVEAAGNVLADWEYCGSPGIPGGIIGKPQLVLLKAALAKFGGVL